MSAITNPLVTMFANRVVECAMKQLDAARSARSLVELYDAAKIEAEFAGTKGNDTLGDSLATKEMITKVYDLTREYELSFYGNEQVAAYLLEFVTKAAVAAPSEAP